MNKKLGFLLEKSYNFRKMFLEFIEMSPNYNGPTLLNKASESFTGS